MNRIEVDQLLEKTGVSEYCRRAFYRTQYFDKVNQFDERYDEEDIIAAARAFDALMPLDQATIFLNVSGYYADIIALVGDITNGEYQNTDRIVYMTAPEGSEVDDYKLGCALFHVMGVPEMRGYIPCSYKGVEQTLTDNGAGLLAKNGEFGFVDKSTWEGVDYYYIETEYLHAWRD